MKKEEAAEVEVESRVDVEEVSITYSKTGESASTVESTEGGSTGL